MSTELPDFMKPGWRAEIGRHTFAAEEIIRFARSYDPQRFHMDGEAAKSSVLGGLCASGWHTASMWMRKQRDYMRDHIAELEAKDEPVPQFGPSPGFRNLKWLKPVFANDAITYYNSTTNCRPSGSRPGWYILTGHHWAENQGGEIVLTFESSVFIKYPA